MDCVSLRKLTYIFTFLAHGNITFFLPWEEKRHGYKTWNCVLFVCQKTNDRNVILAGTVVSGGSEKNRWMKPAWFWGTDCLSCPQPGFRCPGAVGCRCDWCTSINLLATSDPWSRSEVGEHPSAPAAFVGSKWPCQVFIPEWACDMCRTSVHSLHLKGKCVWPLLGLHTHKRNTKISRSQNSCQETGLITNFINDSITNILVSSSVQVRSVRINRQEIQLGF